MKSLEQRFWEKVDKRATQECWEWRGAKDGSGYGKLMTGSRSDGSRSLASAHRLSYIFQYGEPPTGAVIRHSCDNPACCNPAHLIVGTHADNTQDKVQRGRMNVKTGAEHHNTQLTELQVQRIRIIGTVLRDTEMARLLGVSKHVIGNARRGKTWKHLTSTQQVLA